MLLVVLSVVLMVADQRLAAMREARSLLEYVVYPLQILANLPNQAGHTLGETLSSRTTLLERNHRLSRENLLLQGRLQQFKALKSENTHLRELLNASQHSSGKVKIARLVSIDLDPYSQRELIDAGRHEGVYTGQPVIDATGLMGQVIQVGPFNAQVLLIADPSSAVPVIDTRSGLRLLAIGTGEPDILDVRSAPVNADIRVGDLLATSGLGERFPPRYPVCRVKKVQREAGNPFAKVQCQPTAKLNHNREVLLLWYHPAHKPAKQPAKPPYGHHEKAK